MASFDSAGAGFSRGLRGGLAIKQQREALAQAAQEKRAKAFGETIVSGRESAVQSFQGMLDILSETIPTAGVDDPQVQQLIEKAPIALQVHASMLDRLKAQANQFVSAGELPPEALEVMPNGDEFLQQHLPKLEAIVFAAQQQSPEAQGAAAGRQSSSEIKALAQSLGKSEEEVAQALGKLPKDSALQRALVDGQPAFVREEEGRLVEVPGAQPIPNGMSLNVGPDGSIQLQTGESLPKATSPTQNRVQDNILNADDGLARLIGIQRSFDPKFVTVPGKLQGFFSEAKEKISPDLLSEDEREFLSDFTTFRQTAFENLNRYIKEITGAQMSPQEADRLRKSIPDPDKDGPTTFKSKMDRSIRDLALARARSVHFLRQNVEGDPWEMIDFREMEKIIDDRVKELTQELGDKNAALEQTAKEFGI